MLSCLGGGGGGAANLLQDLEQATPAHKVKSLAKIVECDVEWHLLFKAFLSCRMEKAISTVERSAHIETQEERSWQGLAGETVLH